MARLRTVKPEFWTDERVGEVSVTARLLFIATWNFADDYGGVDRSSKQLKAQAFPYDNIDCEPLIQELLQVGLLIEYEVGGKKYLHINGFRKHQKVEKPAKPRIPLFEGSPNPPRILPEDSPGSNGSSLGIGVESSGVESTGGGGIASTTPVGKQPTPEGAMAIALRDLGVTVSSMDLVLIAWVREFSVQQAVDAVGIARIRKPHPEPIHPNYLDKILREKARPPPAQVKAVDRITWRPPPDEEPACTAPSSTVSKQH